MPDTRCVSCSVCSAGFERRSRPSEYIGASKARSFIEWTLCAFAPFAPIVPLEHSDARRARQLSNPSITARTTAAVLFAVPSLAVALLTWKLTVSEEMASICAISPEVLPSAVHFRISSSRLVRWTSWTSVGVKVGECQVRDVDQPSHPRFLGLEFGGRKLLARARQGQHAHDAVASRLDWAHPTRSP